MSLSTNKINAGNHLPGKQDARYVVYSKQFNELVEALKALGIGENDFTTDVISEFTSDTGVTIDGVLLKDGSVTSSAPNTSSSETGITAHVGGGIGSATALTEEINVIGTVGSAGDSVLLPVAVVGQSITVINLGTKAANIFPQSGSSINQLSASAAVSIGPNQIMKFFATSTTAWKTLQTVTGTVSQGTDITTGVTLNSRSGIITTQAASAAHDAIHTFTVTNSCVVATSAIRCWIQNYSGTYGTNGVPMVYAENIGTGTFDIKVVNAGTTAALSGTLKIGFEVVL